MPVRDGKLFIRAFREIRSYIIRNQLEPGDLLPTEQEMCQTFGVSRSVLREAIKSMELMGMVQARPGKGTAVQAFTLDFIFQNVLFFNVSGEDKPLGEMFDIRRRLEMSYMRQAFHAVGDEDVRHMRECTDLMLASIGDSVRFTAADKDFHMTLFRALGNSVLNSLMASIWAVDEGFELEKKLPHMVNSVSKHEAIVDALERYDYRAFARAMEAHFSSAKYALSGTFEEY